MPETSMCAVIGLYLNKKLISHYTHSVCTDASNKVLLHNSKDWEKYILGKLETEY